MLKNRLTVLIAAIVIMFAATHAFAATGSSIFASNGTNNAANSLDADSDYAEITSSIKQCPSGWTKSQNTCSYIISNENGTSIFGETGWEIIDLTADNSSTAVSSITVESSDLCTADTCTDYNSGLGARIFITEDLQASTISWAHVGSCPLVNDEQFNSCVKILTGSTMVEGILLTRGTQPKAWGNIGIHSISFE